ncbi:MAG: hypothetical protein ABIP06_02825, partial [Pyrinomonadaceae bacterium]
MSTTKKKFSLSIILMEVLLFALAVSAQEIEVKIAIKLLSPNASVEGSFLKENFLQSGKNWSFANSVASAENLGRRISNLNLKDKNGSAVNFKK